MPSRLVLAAAGVVSAGALAVAGWRFASLEAPEPPPAPPPVALPTAPPVIAEREGVRVGFDLALAPRPLEAERGAPLRGTARVTLTDLKTGEPLQGRRPLAWMSLRPKDGGPLDDTACREQVRTYLNGLLSARAEVDLNTYWFITLNHDHTLSVINPQLAFDRTKLHSLVSVGGEVADWAMLPDRSALYTTLPHAHAVSVVDLQRFLVLRSVPVGERPGRVAVAPDGRTAWVGNDGDGTVSVLDTASHTVVGTVEVGAGRHEFAFSDEGRTVWISGDQGSTLSAVDVASREVLGTLDVGVGTGPLAFSAVARAVFVAQPRTNEVLVVDTARREVARRIAVKPDLTALRFDPTGRWAFLVHREPGVVDILDAARSQVAHTLTGFSAPDTVVFTDAFAYVRNTQASRVSLIELKSLEGAGVPSVIAVTMGQKLPADARNLGRSDPIAALPEGNGVIVAGAADRALYLYQQGMMAPSGTHLNYGREPRAVMVLDRSLREVGKGTFSAEATVRENGVYDVQVLLDQPRAVVCLEWKVGGVPEDASRARKLPLQLTPEFDAAATYTAGTSVPMRFKLEPLKDSGQPPLRPEEVRVLMFRTPGTWQWRTEPRDLGDGRFEVEFNPPTAGQYKFVVGVEDRNIDLGRLPTFTLGVVDAPATAVAASPEVP